MSSGGSTLRHGRFPKTYLFPSNSLYLNTCASLGSFSKIRLRFCAEDLFCPLESMSNSFIHSMESPCGSSSSSRFLKSYFA